VAGDDATLAVDQQWIGETKLLDGRGDPVDLRLAVGARVVLLRHQPFDALDAMLAEPLGAGVAHSGRPASPAPARFRGEIQGWGSRRRRRRAPPLRRLGRYVCIHTRMS
jgi:hypothetical protein